MLSYITNMIKEISDFLAAQQACLFGAKLLPELILRSSLRTEIQ